MESPSTGGDVAVAFAAGFSAALLIVLVALLSYFRMNDIYDLSHWKLNFHTRVETMWMNMGYWVYEDSKQPVEEFWIACSELLSVMLEKAAINPYASHAFLDLGFGCGDQITELVKKIPYADFRIRADKVLKPFNYVGLTLNQTQLETALRFIPHELKAVNHKARTVSGGRFTTTNGEAAIITTNSLKLFCANAAAPTTWNIEVREAVNSLADKELDERWLLALDCLYHFKPSRKPILEYANRKLDLNLLAFDLILNAEASLWDKLALKLVGLLMGCPLRAFLTEKDYRSQLEECGYSHVETYNISEKVFPGISAYMKDQEQRLNQFGISLGGLKWAGKLFGWFNTSKVVQATIVVAKSKGKSS